MNTIERQCEPDFIRSFLTLPDGTDAVLSLACGAGVQTMAAAFDPLPVIPALNTTFMGANREPGVWQEMCRGCGDCMLAYTGGICPIARCAKSLFNGPCGGSKNGSCEVRKDIPCALGHDLLQTEKAEPASCDDARPKAQGLAAGRRERSP